MAGRATALVGALAARLVEASAQVAVVGLTVDQAGMARAPSQAAACQRAPYKRAVAAVAQGRSVDALGAVGRQVAPAGDLAVTWLLRLPVAGRLAAVHGSEVERLTQVEPLRQALPRLLMLQAATAAAPGL